MIQQSIWQSVTLFIVTLAAALAMLAVLVAPKASAVSGTCHFGGGSCGVSGLGDYGTNDVFNGRSSTGSGLAITYGEINNKSEFISFMASRFDASRTRAGSTKEGIGAALVIDMMTAGSGWPSAARENRWIDLMRQDSVTVQNASWTVTRSSWYVPGQKNVFFANRSATTRDVIIIRQHGDIKLILQRECGNPTGAYSPLTEDGWNIVPRAQKTTAANVVNPGATVGFAFQAENANANGADRHITVTDWRWETRQFVYRGGTRIVSTVIQNNDSPANLAPNSPRSIGGAASQNMTIPAGARDGDIYCRALRIAPPSHTESGWELSPERCVTVDVPVPPNCIVGGGLRLYESGEDTLLVGSPTEGQGFRVSLGVRTSNSAHTGVRITASGELSELNGVTLPISPPTGPDKWSTISGVVDAAAGSHSFSWQIVTNTGALFGTSCPGTVVVSSPPPPPARPFFQTLNGDTAALGPIDANRCAAGTGGIATFNEGPAGYLGSGSQIAAFASGAIEQFASGQRAPGVLGGSPKYLTFANTDSTADYGGNFGNPSYCLGDYWDGAGAADIYISSNSARPAFTGVDAINVPVFATEGDIYIAAGVTNIYGILAAKGTIYTCASGAGSAYADDQLVANCSTQLTIDGAAIAGNGIRFQRVIGGLDAGNTPAEIFNYTPEVWLQAAKPGVAPPGEPTYTIQSLRTLPPIF